MSEEKQQESTQHVPFHFILNYVSCANEKHIELKKISV